MFNKQMAEAARSALHSALSFPRASNSVIASGFTKRSLFFVASFARTKKLNPVLTEDLGEGGKLELSYHKKKILSLEIRITWDKNDPEYAAFTDVFLQNDEANGNGEYDEQKFFADGPAPHAIYTVKHVELEDVEERAKKLVSYVNRLLTVYHAKIAK